MKSNLTSDTHSLFNDWHMGSGVSPPSSGLKEVFLCVCDWVSVCARACVYNIDCEITQTIKYSCMLLKSVTLYNIYMSGVIETSSRFLYDNIPDVWRGADRATGPNPNLHNDASAQRLLGRYRSPSSEGVLSQSIQRPAWHVLPHWLDYQPFVSHNCLPHASVCIFCSTCEAYLSSLFIKKEQIRN